MKIHLLGTGAADGIPSMFSHSWVSDYARKYGGREVRSRAAALIDGILKIDLPPDTWMQCMRDSLDPRDWVSVLFTHSDDDHFAIKELQYVVWPFTELEFFPFAIYGNDTICDLLEKTYPDWPLEIVRTRSFQSFQMGEYKITPVKAKHLEGEDAQNLIVEREGKKILYATDTGVWDEPTWDFLKGADLDCLVIECTEGFKPTDYFGHMDIRECVATVERLHASGGLKSGAIIATTHHSHLGEATYTELVSALEPHGITAGYDGLVIEF